MLLGCSMSVLECRKGMAWIISMGEYYVVGVLLVLELANLHVPSLSRSADILEGKGDNLV